MTLNLTASVLLQPLAGYEVPLLRRGGFVTRDS
jgi:hypothetical protein